MHEEVVNQLESQHWHVPHFKYKNTTPPKSFETYSVKNGTKVLHRFSVVFIDTKSKKNSAIMRFNSFTSKRAAKFYSEIFRDILELRGRRECHDKHKTIIGLDADGLVLLLDCLREDKLALLRGFSSLESSPTDTAALQVCMFNKEDIRNDAKFCGELEWFDIWTEKYYTHYPCVVCFVAPKTGNECAGSQFHYDQNNKLFILEALQCETSFERRMIFADVETEDITLFHVMRYNTEDPDICQALFGCALARWELIGHLTNLSCSTKASYFSASYEGNVKTLAINAHRSVIEGNARQPPLSQSTDSYFCNANNHTSDEVYAQRYADVLMQIVIIVNLNERSDKAARWFVPAAYPTSQERCTSDKVFVVVRTKQGLGTVGPKYWASRFTCCCGLPNK